MGCLELICVQVLNEGTKCSRETLSFISADSEERQEPGEPGEQQHLMRG